MAFEALPVLGTSSLKAENAEGGLSTECSGCVKYRDIVGKTKKKMPAKRLQPLLLNFLQSSPRLAVSRIHGAFLDHWKRDGSSERGEANPVMRHLTSLREKGGDDDGSETRDDGGRLPLVG